MPQRLAGEPVNLGEEIPLPMLSGPPWRIWYVHVTAEQGKVLQELDDALFRALGGQSLPEDRSVADHLEELGIVVDELFGGSDTVAAQHEFVESVVKLPPHQRVPSYRETRDVRSIARDDETLMLFHQAHPDRLFPDNPVGWMQDALIGFENLDPVPWAIPHPTWRTCGRDFPLCYLFRYEVSRIDPQLGKGEVVPHVYVGDFSADVALSAWEAFFWHEQIKRAYRCIARQLQLAWKEISDGTQPDPIACFRKKPTAEGIAEVKVFLEGLPEIEWSRPKSTDQDAGQASGLGELPHSREVAYRQYLYAQEKAPDRETDAELYDWLKHTEDLPDGVDALPIFETWSKYVREARKHYGTSKNAPKTGRATGKSVVPEDQI